MWKLKEKPKTVKVTKATAERFRDMDPVPNERPLSERRLQVYHRILAAGEFRPCVWATAFCEETGSTHRVNGQHTSTLISGIPVTPDFYATIEEYLCDTMEDVARLYATFDSRASVRSTTDINRSFAAAVPSGQTRQQT